VRLHQDETGELNRDVFPESWSEAERLKRERKLLTRMEIVEKIVVVGPESVRWSRASDRSIGVMGCVGNVAREYATRRLG